MPGWTAGYEYTYYLPTPGASVVSDMNKMNSNSQFQVDFNGLYMLIEDGGVTVTMTNTKVVIPELPGGGGGGGDDPTVFIPVGGGGGENPTTEPPTTTTTEAPTTTTEELVEVDAALPMTGKISDNFCYALSALILAVSLIMRKFLIK